MLQLNGHMKEKMSTATQREQELAAELARYQHIAQAAQYETLRLRDRLSKERSHEGEHEGMLNEVRLRGSIMEICSGQQTGNALVSAKRSPDVHDAYYNDERGEAMRTKHQARLVFVSSLAAV